MKQHYAIVIIVTLLDSKTETLLSELYLFYRQTSKTVKTNWQWTVALLTLDNEIFWEKFGRTVPEVYCWRKVVTKNRCKDKADEEKGNRKSKDSS
jgi:hypothetical protein